MWIAYAFASAFFAGVTSILAKIGISKVDSTLATAIRTVVVAIFAWILVAVIGEHFRLDRIDARSLAFLVLSGLTTGVSWLCYFRALRTGDINQVVPIDKSSTVLAMLLAFVLLGEGVTALKCFAMALMSGGTWMMVGKRERANPEAEGRGWLFYAALSAVFAALTAILGKIGIEGVESNLGTAIRTVVVAVMAWMLVAARKTTREIGRIDRRGWLFLILSGLATGLSWLCYYRALQEGPASVVVPIDKLGILVAVAFGCLVFREKLTAFSAIGLAFVTIGTLLLLV
ncbi:MAG: EamA family transporter [Planctomycetota bacterium]|jgi:transporter family protein|nr:EamA family transporter [Planctomycetota bacterium]